MLDLLELDPHSNTSYHLESSKLFQTCADRFYKACMDPRSNPNELWGITESNPGAAVFRNAGGRVTEDVLRSIRVLSGISGYGECNQRRPH